MIGLTWHGLGVGWRSVAIAVMPRMTTAASTAAPTRAPARYRRNRLMVISMERPEDVSSGSEVVTRTVA